MNLKLYFFFGLVLISSSPFLFAQTDFCPDDPPINEFLADSPWPIYHRNNFAQSSTCIAGPMPGDSLIIKAKTQIQGGTSPWVYLSDEYPNGERVLLQSTSTHVFKFIDHGDQIITIDSLRIDFDPISSFGWNFLLAKDKIWFTYDPKYDPENNQFTRLIKLADEDSNDPYSDIQIIDEFNFGDYGVNRVQHFSMAYDGSIIFNSENNGELGYATTGVISQDLQLLDTIQYPTFENEIVHHNAFPIDEFNNYYIVTTHRLIKFNWDGNAISKVWEAAYDFVNDGPTGSFAEGSGTTPTLLGWGADNDKLIVVADGHANNNLVAFWREVPEDWTGIPGQDIHFAGSITIPAASSFSNIFQSIENSPTAFDYDIAIAQFNGFLGYDCDNNKGVQKIHWNTQDNNFEIAWTNTDINMNGVLTYSAGSNLLYGSGKEEDCNYYYYGLNWDSGELAFRQLLGPEGSFLNDPFYDAGNNNIIDELGNIYFPGGGSLVKLEIVPNPTNEQNLGLETTILSVYPNPAQTTVHLEVDFSGPYRLKVFQFDGRKHYDSLLENDSALNIGAWPSGVYFFEVQEGENIYRAKLVKQ